MSSLFLAITAAALYFGAAALLLLRLAAPAVRRRVSMLKALAPAVFALLPHAWLLSEQLFTAAGLDFGLFNALSLIGALAAILLLLITLVRPVDNLGIGLFPLVAAIVLMSDAWSTHRLLSSHPEVPIPIQVHVLISILAYSLLTLAAFQAVLVAVEDHFLRNRRPVGFIRALPPLATMESIMFGLLGTGFGLLTLALASGFFFLDDIFAQHLVHKTVLSLLAWLVFAVLLIGRLRFGWRGQKAIRWTLGGFLSLLLAYVGSKLVLEVILGGRA